MTRITLNRHSVNYLFASIDSTQNYSRPDDEFMPHLVYIFLSRKEKYSLLNKEKCEKNHKISAHHEAFYHENRKII